MLHPPAVDRKFDTIIFRNDDVAFDSDVEHLKRLSEVFHRFGFVQLHGIVLYGRCNDSCVVDGIPWMYDSIRPNEIFQYEKCVEVSTDYIGNNRELVDYLNHVPDRIALHGLYHSDYSQMSYEQQEQDIREGLYLLKRLFPNKKVDTFIAPFNHTNEDTYQVCEKYGLRVSALEGEHLEDRMANGKGPLYEGELYRYHHHRFYPDSTFYYYDLSIERLEDYFRRFAYTLVKRTGKTKPSLGLVKACQIECGEKERVGTVHMKRDIQDAVERCVLEYLNFEDSIIQIDCGAGDLLHRLWAFGYKKLMGYDADEYAVNVSNRIAETIGSEVIAKAGSCADLHRSEQATAIIYSYDPSTGNGKSTWEIFHGASKALEDIGYIILANPKEREEEVIDVAGKFNAMLVNEAPYSQKKGQRVYVFKRIRPGICLLCDRPNWAHDNSARELKKYLSDEFEIDIKYVIKHEMLQPDLYDAFLVFFWGERSYQESAYSRSRIIKQVSSHRWQYDAPYGPISVEEFADKYLADADTVICPSEILHKMLRPVAKNIFLCGKGYAPELFKYTRSRMGEMKLCMVGNLKDPVKGVEDLLKPSAEGYHLDIAQDIDHEKLVDFYNDHDLYVVASVHEADPLPLIEAMACGCFPVASKIGIAPELIRHKENGYLVRERTVEEFKEAFRWCEANIDQIRNRASGIAEELFQTRRWEIMAENYRQMFRDHMGRR